MSEASEQPSSPATEPAKEPSAASVATGVLAAEARARESIDRRRRLLMSGAVLGLVVVGAVLAVMAILQNQANREATERAARGESRAELAAAVVGAAEDHELPTVAINADAERLRRALEEHLLVSARSDEEIAAETSAAADRLRASADQLTAIGDQPLPSPDLLVSPEVARAVLQQLETLRAESAALAAEVMAAADNATSWAAVVRSVTEAVALHVEHVEAEEATTEPDALIALWNAERPGLEKIAEQARAAARIDGLGPWAEAHQAYAAASLDWIDAAVAMLESVDVDAYNAHYEAAFGVDDPFGFGAAVEAATDSALESSALTDLVVVRQRADLVLTEIMDLELEVAEQLDADHLPGDAATP